MKKFSTACRARPARHPVDKGLRGGRNPCASLNLGYDI